jgi:hypothetical protein
MAAQLGPDYHSLLSVVKEGVPADLQIVMAHQCSYHGRKFVHLSLKNDSHLLSLVEDLCTGILILKKGRVVLHARELLAEGVREVGVVQHQRSRLGKLAFERRAHRFVGPPASEP